MGMAETEQIIEELPDAISSVMELFGTEAQGHAGLTYAQIIGRDLPIVLVVS
jgi:hypothetical protein